MGVGGWIIHNWFELLSSVGIVGGLWYTGVSVHSGAKAQRIANLLTLTTNHRELWSAFYSNPKLSRILDASLDVPAHPPTGEETGFVNAVIQHLSSAFHTMQSDLTIKPDALGRDITEFFALPIPRAVWLQLKPFQDRQFVEFIEASVQ